MASDAGRTITREVKAGAVITTLIVLLVAFLVAYGKFARAVSSTREVRVVYPSVSNLRAEARVYYNGLQIGKVGRIQLLEMNDQTLAELPEFSAHDLINLPFTEEERAAFKDIPAAQINAEIRKRLVGKSMVELLLDIRNEEDKKRFHDDDQVRMGSTLMGESSIQIFAGTGKTIDSSKAKVYMGQGGDMYSSLANALSQVKNILETAAELMGGGSDSPMAKKIAGLDEFTANLENRAGNLETNASQLLAKADTRLDEAREAFSSMDTAVQNLKPELTKTLDKAQTQLLTVRQNVAKVTQSGRKTIQDLRNNFIADLVEIAKQMKERRATWPTLLRDAREWTEALRPKIDWMNGELDTLSHRLKSSSPELKGSLANYNEQVRMLEEKTWYYAHYPWLAFNNATDEEEKEMLYERRKDVLTRRYKELRPMFDKAFTTGVFDPARKSQVMAIVSEMDDYLLSVPKPAGGKK